MVQANPDLSSQNAASGSDPLASLYKMSTTAGLGSQDYVAVNVLSVVALAIGLASTLVFLDSILLVIPVAGVIIGVLALIQIRKSAGTQTGTVWAVIGLLLSLGLAGYKFGNEAVAAAKSYADETAIKQTLTTLSDKVVKPETTEQAYALFTDTFHARITPDLFKARWAAMRTREILGDLTNIQSNNVVRVETDPKTKATQGVTGAVFKYSKTQAGERRNIFFLKAGNDWKIDSIPDMFPDGLKQPETPGQGG